MIYKNSELRLDQIVTYINEEKINLSPVFQRGHVWSLPVRQKLVKNILLGKPIPAIFLYKEASGSRFLYNILDGKQRLESLILFISSTRRDFRIPNWKRYFFYERQRRDAGFSVELPGGPKKFDQLDDSAIRDLREYSIPTIEITLNDESALDDMISLFVDINQYGVKVNRFDIVKAMGRNDPLLMDVFQLIAEKQNRGRDIFYRTRRTPFTNILKNMKIVEKLPDGKSQVDRMWERLLELVLYLRNLKHRKPVEILKSFISKPDQPSPRLSAKETKDLRRIFVFLGTAYEQGSLKETRLATDQTHFYTMVTSLIGSNFLDRFGPGDLARRLEHFARVLEGRESNKKIASRMKRYQELSAKQTTDVSRRAERQEQFIKIIEGFEQE